MAEPIQKTEYTGKRNGANKMKKLKIIAGNCILENKQISFDTAFFLKQISKEYNLELTYKSSFLKDNRSSEKYYMGLGIEKSIKIFEYLKKEFGLNLITDFHHLDEVDIFKDVIDIYQIPAYLCMQTKLSLKIANLGKPINVKKGQFLHPSDMQRVIKKIESTGNKNIFVTERGTCFGYRDLIVDPRSFYIMKQFGYPVFFDVTHSVRKYGVPSSDLKNGGSKEFVYALAKSAIATGCVDGLFIETHPTPDKALCDAATQLSFNEFRKMIKEVIPIWNITKGGSK